jgi:hypothetical protein
MSLQHYLIMADVLFLFYENAIYNPVKASQGKSLLSSSSNIYHKFSAESMKKEAN